MIAVILTGFCAAILWVAQGKYFTKCATIESRGLYFGRFWSFYSGSQILSSLFGFLLLHAKIGHLDKTWFHVVMATISFVAVIIFSRVKLPYVHSSNILQRSFRLSNQSNYYTDPGDSMVRSQSEFSMKF